MTYLNKTKERMFFKNSNGKEYEVIRVDFRANVALLLPLKTTWEDAPYLVVTGFNPTTDSWDSGIYDLTLEEATECFNEKV